MKKKIIISVVIFVVIVGIVLGFSLFNRNKNSAINYKKEAVGKGDIQAVVVTTGSLNPVIIVIGEAKNVLKVPNAALRFTPELTQEEMEEIKESMKERMMARRKSQGDSARSRRPQGAHSPREGQPPSGHGEFNPQAAARFQQMPRVWIEDEEGKLRLVFIRNGTDRRSPQDSTQNCPRSRRRF